MYNVEASYNEFVDYFNDQDISSAKDIIQFRNELEYQKTLLFDVAMKMIDQIEINYSDYELEDWLLSELEDFRKEYKDFFKEEVPIVREHLINQYIERARAIYLNRFPIISQKSIDRNISLEQEIIIFSQAISKFEIQINALNLIIRRVLRPPFPKKFNYFANENHRNALKVIERGPTSEYQSLYEHLEYDLGWNSEMRKEYLERFKNDEAISKEILKYLKEKFPHRNKFPAPKTLKEKLGLLPASGRKIIGE